MPDISDNQLSIWKDIMGLDRRTVSFIIIATICTLLINFRYIMSFLSRNVFRKDTCKRKTKKDIEKHPVFNDLIYWADTQVDYIYVDGDPVKLKVAKAMLRINFVTANTWLKSLVKKICDEDLTTHQIRNIVHKEFDSLSSLQWSKYIERGIPPQFLKKFNEINSINKEYISNRISEIFTDELPLTIYEKLHLVLNSLNTYYGALFTDLPKTVQSINGDLRGQIFDNEEFGAFEKQKIYLPPDPNYIVHANNKLSELLHCTMCSRASLYAFHDSTDGTIENGKCSAIYEVLSPGVCSVKLESNYIDMYPHSQLVQQLRKGNLQIIYPETVDPSMYDRLKHMGCEVAVMYPVFKESKLIGFIFLQWLKKEILNYVDKDTLEQSLEKYSFKCTQYIDYSYDNCKD